MTAVDNLRLALRGLAGNKLRSSLTMLGILIGVGAVIILVAVGNGSSVAVQKDITTLGTNTITVTNSGYSSSATATQDRSSTLTVADLALLTDKVQAPDVRSASPVISSSAYVAEGDEEESSTVTGTDASYLAAEDDTLAGGTNLTAADVRTHAKVAVISQALADQIFATGTNPVGKQVLVGSVQFDVVGVIATKSSAGTVGDYSVLVPYTTSEDELTGYSSTLSTVVLQARSSEAVTDAEDEAAAILATVNHTTVADLPFTLTTQSSLLSTARSTNSTFTVLLAAVAALSLLVGGIGIMNIMLVTVTERTREIGIRKAVGAPKTAILGQFLGEATLLSGLGGLCGLAVGLVGSHFTIDGVQPLVTTTSIVAALAVSMLIGVFFGWYPANRAASLRPIDALRYE